jgi:hydrogenase maturation protein HypF
MEDLALGFHHALANGLVEVCSRVRELGGPRNVVLCGGVFQNLLLTRLTCHALRSAGLIPWAPGVIPVNDGGLALGQIVIANAQRDADAPDRRED